MDTKKAKAPRLSPMEKRAKAFAESIKSYGATSFSVDWAKSSTWGMCPRVFHNGEKVSHASGCGYCKHSAALAQRAEHLVAVSNAAGCRWSIYNCEASPANWDNALYLRFLARVGKLNAKGKLDLLPH